MDNIELRVTPESDIAGRLLAETSDSPQPNAQTKVTLRELNSGSNVGDPAPVAADYSFQLKGVPAGLCEIDAPRDDGV